MEHTLVLKTIEPLTHDTYRLVFDKPTGYEYAPGQATELTLHREGLRDQPRLHRCNHSTYTSRSAFSAVVCPGGARIVVVSSPPSDPSGGRGDALKAKPPRAAPDDSGLSGRPGAAYKRPGRLSNDAAPWGARGQPPPSGTTAELRGPS